MMRINRNALSFTPAEFASLMGVSYNAVRYWLKKGLIPGAYEQGDGHITIKRWRIPRQALEMTRPQRGGKQVGASLFKNKREATKAYLDLKQQFSEHLEKYAGLMGRYDKLEIDKTLELEILQGQLDFQLQRAEAYKKMYEEMKSKLPKDSQ